MTTTDKIIRNKIWYFLIQPLRRIYWFTFRPKRLAVVCIIKHKDHFLLTRPNYGHKQWIFPGGHVHSGETFETAIKREIFEELNISLNKVTALGVYPVEWQYKKYDITYFFAEIDDPKFTCDRIEIGEADWFLEENIPEDCHKQVPWLLGIYKTHYYRLDDFRLSYIR
tara:strand:+ start:997 stop:1500 length:504 start_codon:yes stop_codon:yes gene_type:complete